MDATDNMAAGDGPEAPPDADSRDNHGEWRAVRHFLNSRRHQLALTAQQLYPAAQRVARTPLLAQPGWLPAAPVPLEEVTLSWHDDVPAPETAGDFGFGGLELPGAFALRDDGSPFASYADALGALSRPGIFEDRFCYRLLDAAAVPGGGVALRFGPGRYFELVNTCEAVAHEYAAAVLADGGSGRCPTLDELPQRSLIGDPTDLLRRPVMTATCTLVLRADRDTGQAAMVLHWRDPAQVASGGGMYQVAPVGMFQPSDDAGWNRANDFDLWRSITRELSEELLGGGEDYHSDTAPIDYEHWPLFAELSKARSAGTLRVYWLGLGVDPLSLAADMLTVAVFDPAVFDAVFSGLVSANDEGHMVSGRADGTEVGVAFSEESIERFGAREPMQPAGAALLRTAWAHRSTLLS